jgi:hypothetical protein
LFVFVGSVRSDMEELKKKAKEKARKEHEARKLKAMRE